MDQTQTGLVGRLALFKHTSRPALRQRFQLAKQDPLQETNIGRRRELISGEFRLISYLLSLDQVYGTLLRSTSTS